MKQLINKGKLYGKGTNTPNPYDKHVSADELGLRRCHCCGEFKVPVVGFSLNPHRKSGYRRLCRNCNRRLAGLENSRKMKGREISKAFRDLVYREYYNSCKHCGTTKHLTVHHIVPVSQGGAVESLSNCLLLCKSCHDAVHSRMNSKESLAQKQLRHHGKERVQIVKYDPESGKVVPFKIGQPEPFPWQYR